MLGKVTLPPEVKIVLNGVTWAIVELKNPAGRFTGVRLFSTCVSVNVPLVEPSGKLDEAPAGTSKVMLFDCTAPASFAADAVETLIARLAKPFDVPTLTSVPVACCSEIGRAN